MRRDTLTRYIETCHYPIWTLRRKEKENCFII